MVQVNDDSAMAVEEARNGASPAAATVLVAVKDDPLPAGVSQVDFDNALAVGRAKGSLSPDELIDVLHDVELTPEVLVALLSRINAEGVALVDDDVDALAEGIAERVQSRTAARERGQRQRAAAQVERRSARRRPNPRAVQRTPFTPTSKR